MKRTQYSTTIEAEVLKTFKEKCDKDRINMNEVIELLMQLYVDKKIIVERNVKVNL